MTFPKKKTDFAFPSYIKVQNKTFDVEVVFLKKKSSSVSIKGNKLNFRLSSNLSKNDTNHHFNELLEKITKKIEKKPLLVKKSVKFKEIFDKGSFIFAGERYYLEYNKKRGVSLSDFVFHINYHTNEELMEKYIVKILCMKYHKTMKEYIDAVNMQTYNFDIGRFSLKLTSSKWGHCSHNDDIMLNLRLLNAEIDVLNYVIFHEISHIKHKNHSEKFWQEVQRFCPNYKVLRKRLKENPPELFILK